MSAPAAKVAPRWLFGPGPDLLLGCGGAFLLFFLLMAFAGPQVRALAPIGLLPLLTLVTSTPHYGATLLRVYERAADRRAYQVFSVWATLLIFGTFVGGVYDAWVGSILLTVYLTWSPWHYSGQNYGIALLFLRRRGVQVTPGAKRALYASFLFSFALTFVATHGTDTRDGSYTPVDLSGSAYHLVSLGIPVHTMATLIAGFGLAWIGSLVLGTILLRRGAGWRDLGPAAALLGLQGIWFAIPVLSRATTLLQGVTPLSLNYAEYVLFWMAMAHAVQYLWVTTFYAISRGDETRRGRYLLKALLAGGVVWGVPTLIFAPELLGTRAFDAGLAALVASAVNVHHFVLDGAIWKLRDGRIARILIRSDAGVRAAPVDGRAGRPWLRAALAGVGALYIATSAVGTVEDEFGVRRAAAAHDVERMREATRRLRWIGRDPAGAHLQLGIFALRDGDWRAARSELVRAAELNPTAFAWSALGNAELRLGDVDAALEAFERALALDADHVNALAGAARASLRRGDGTRAAEFLERALRLAPEREDLRALQRLAPPPPTAASAPAPRSG
jgi:tetratricopeptide (TPR) repeat protein